MIFIKNIALHNFIVVITSLIQTTDMTEIIPHNLYHSHGNSDRPEDVDVKLQKAANLQRLQQSLVRRKPMVPGKENHVRVNLVEVMMDKYCRPGHS